MASHINWPQRAGTGAARAVARLPEAAASSLIIALFAPLAALTSPKMQRFLLAVAILNIPLTFGVHIGYREDMGDLGSLGGWFVSPGTFALAGLYTALLFKLPRGGVAQVLSRIHFSVPLNLYLVFCVLSLLTAPDVTLGLFEVFLLLQMLLLYLYISNAVTSEDDVLFVIRLLLIGVVMEGLFMVALANGWTGGRILGMRTRLDENSSMGLDRLGGTLGSPNDAAAYLSQMLGVALGVTLARSGRWYKYLAVLAVISAAAALVLTFSRGGWLAAAVSFALFIIICAKSRRISWKLPAAAAVLAVVVLMFFAPDIETRLSQDDNGAAYARVPLMKLSALMIEDHPVLGVGANNYPLAMGPYLTRGFAGEFTYAVHNKYLLIWTEAGFGALVAYVWFLLSAVRKGFHCWRLGSPVLSPIALGCTVAMVGHMVHMMVDLFRGGPSQELLWLEAGLLMALQRQLTSADVAQARLARQRTENVSRHESGISFVRFR